MYPGATAVYLGRRDLEKALGTEASKLFSIQFKDRPNESGGVRFVGDYTIYLKIEKVSNPIGSVASNK